MKNKSKPEVICKILKIGKTTYYKYLKENVPIVIFLLNFSKEELEEFLTTGKIEKMELIKDKSVNEIKEAFKVSHNEKLLAQIEELKKQLK